MPSYKATVGNVELVSVSDGHADRAPVDVFPASTLEQWRTDYPELLDEQAHIHPRYGSVVARSGGRLILVDTGQKTPPGGTLVDEMRQSGIEREAIDLVVLTHLHPDHVGWNLTDGRPTFPNARYLATRIDWEYWTQPSVLENAAHVRDSVMPLDKLDLLDLIDGEYKITDELTTLPTPGHTPGHTSIVIASAGERGFILGDVAHSVAQAHYTDWNPIFDIQPEVSPKTRHEVLDRLEAEGILVSAGHFPGSGFGRFVRRDGRRVWQEI